MFFDSTAWDCTCSIALLVVLSDGSQRVSPSSRIGQLRLIYASNLPLSGASCMQRVFYTAKNFHALFILDTIWLSNFRLDSISKNRRSWLSACATLPDCLQSSVPIGYNNNSASKYDVFLYDLLCYLNSRDLSKLSYCKKYANFVMIRRNSSLFNTLKCLQSRPTNPTSCLAYETHVGLCVSLSFLS